MGLIKCIADRQGPIGDLVPSSGLRQIGLSRQNFRVHRRFDRIPFPDSGPSLGLVSLEVQVHRNFSEFSRHDELEETWRK